MTHTLPASMDFINLVLVKEIKAGFLPCHLENRRNWLRRRRCHILQTLHHLHCFLHYLHLGPQFCHLGLGYLRFCQLALRFLFLSRRLVRRRWQVLETLGETPSSSPILNTTSLGFRTHLRWFEVYSSLPVLTRKFSVPDGRVVSAGSIQSPGEPVRARPSSSPQGPGASLGPMSHSGTEPPLSMPGLAPGMAH